MPWPSHRRRLVLADNQSVKIRVMAIRAILVSVSGGEASEGAVETACRLARRFGAHLEALHVRPDPAGALPLLGQGLSAPVASELIELANRESKACTAKAKAVVDAAAARHAFPLRDKPASIGEATSGMASISWREELGHASAIVPLRGQLADLVVLGQSGRVVDKPHSDTLEETVIRSGRPVLLAPARPTVSVGEVIAIAWNASPAAARAVSGAMPFLTPAREVHVLTACEDDGAPPDTGLALYLAWHGVAAACHGIRPVKGIGTGELLLAAARDHGADLLVMGGYGHAPWREMIFGGATREIVGSSRLPVLLAH